MVHGKINSRETKRLRLPTLKFVNVYQHIQLHALLLLFNNSMFLDVIMKKSNIIISMLIGVAVLTYIYNYDSRVAELNNKLKVDMVLSSYPYQFHVISIDNRIAKMTTPRSAQAPASRSLKFMFSHLVYESENSEKMITAQKELAQVQSRAAELVIEHNDVDKVIWELDERWLRGHGVML